MIPNIPGPPVCSGSAAGTGIGDVPLNDTGVMPAESSNSPVSVQAGQGVTRANVPSGGRALCAMKLPTSKAVQGSEGSPHAATTRTSCSSRRKLPVAASAPQLHAWRRAAREGLLPMPEDKALGLVPILVEGDDRARAEPPAGGTLTLEVGGVRILVPVDFDAGHLGRVISVLRGAP